MKLGREKKIYKMIAYTTLVQNIFYDHASHVIDWRGITGQPIPQYFNLYIWNILIYFRKKQKWLVLFFGILKC